jgi:hypothetical protein
VLCLFFIHLFSIHSIAHGSILCFGDDGHVGIVTSGSDLCCGSSAVDILIVKAESGFISGAPLSDNCIDIPISDICNDNGLLKRSFSVAHPLQSLQAARNSVTLTADILPQNTFFNSVPHLSIPLLSFSTVSLLI